MNCVITIALFIILLMVLIYVINKSYSKEPFMSCSKRHKNFAGNTWHLRFPYMVKQRYSYDDMPDGMTEYTINGYARLKDLPLDLIYFPYLY